MTVSYILMANDTSNIANQNGWSSAFATLGQLFFLTVVVVFVLFLTVQTTKLVARMKLGGVNNLNIKIIETLPVGYQQMALQLIKAGNKYFVIGITKDRISFLTDVDADSLEFADKEAFSVLSGKELFDKYLKNFIDRNKKQD